MLWFYTFWTAGAFVEYIASQNGFTIGPAFGLVLGTAAAALFAGDPRHVIWARSAAEQCRAIAMARTIRTPA
jgi:hypothetical protein